MIRFTVGDLLRANAEWQCNCGPASLAVICGLTLDEVRPHFQPAFPGWTTPSRMFQALTSTGLKWNSIQTSKSGAAAHLPTWGIARVQWHGPWTYTGANPRWAYVHTHWVGVSKLRRLDGKDVELFVAPDEICIWDINAMSLGEGWAPLAWWSSQVVPALTIDIPRATGGWHITHAIEVER